MATKKLRESDIADAGMYAGKIKRLALALIKHGSTVEEAESFIASAKGVTDKNKEQVADWFCENLPKLEAREDYKEICEDCACCLGGKRYEAARAIFSEEPTLEARIKRLINTPFIVGYRGETVDDKTFIVRFFPECEFYRCSCLKFPRGKQKRPMPEGYCYCCGGHLKHHIQKALGCAVEVEFITSSLVTMGAEGCRFKVTLLD